MTSVSDSDILRVYEVEKATGDNRLYARMARSLLPEHVGDKNALRSLSTRCRRVVHKHLSPTNEEKTSQQKQWSRSKLYYIYLST